MERHLPTRPRPCHGTTMAGDIVFPGEEFPLNMAGDPLVQKPAIAEVFVRAPITELLDAHMRGLVTKYRFQLLVTEFRVKKKPDFPPVCHARRVLHHRTG